MITKALGETGIRVPLLGLGTVKLGRNTAVKYPKAFELPSDRQAKSLLAMALSLGVNLLDTAPAYGQSEQRLGHLIKGQREQWIVSSKVGEEFVSGQSTFCYTPEHIENSVNRSLKRLNTDYLDIVLLHCHDQDQAVLEQPSVIEALKALKKQGKVRAIGASTKTVAGGLLAASLLDVVMICFNLGDCSQQAVLDYALCHHKGILIKKAFASGHLCDRPQSKASMAYPSMAYKSMVHILQQQAVSSIIVGTLSEQHLADNVEQMRYAWENLQGR